MNKKYCCGKETKHSRFLILENFKFSSLVVALLFLGFYFSGDLTREVRPQSITQQNSFTVGPPSNNYMATSTAFRQEIAKLEINVARQGKTPIPLTQVPRLQKDDILKIRLLDEATNGTKPDQSNWNWTFLVAYINPGLNKDKQKSVSEEIQFKKTGWYKEYSFVVPYDSQPMFFLYSKPKYRDKILSLVNKDYEEIRKVGEKAMELSDAYAKIGSFLDELQFVVNRNSYGSYGYGMSYGGNYGNGSNTYGSSYGNNYGYGNTYGGYGGYGNSFGTTQTLNRNFYMNQAVERLARSFNIQLPQCWQNTYNSYNYGNYGGLGGASNPPGTYFGVSQDFIGRSQCVARSVKVEDFDVSVSRMLQQGGIMAATSLSVKYPQLAFWINIAAAAIDTINKFKRKAPLRIMPTVISTTDGTMQNYAYQNNFSAPTTAYASNPEARPDAVKISLFAESAPNDDGFVTAYPLVIQKWQPNPDPEVISLPTPVLAESCLHPGQNILRSTDLRTDWMADNFTKNFQLVMSSPNGFRKQFPLKKNVGLGGWELMLTKEDLNSFPKIDMTLESVVVGTRGFNEIRSPKFDIPIPNGGKYEIVAESQKAFAVGAKRIITLRNLIGDCKCLQAVVYKPSFGGQFVFDDKLSFSENGREVSFEVDTASFQPGQGILELRQYGGEVFNLSVTLHPAAPEISDVKISKGDNRVIVYGTGLEQIQALKINGKRAVAIGENPTGSITAAGSYQAPMSNSLGVQNYAISNVAVSNISGDKAFVFEDGSQLMSSDNVSLEIELIGNRIYQHPKMFGVSASRPAVITNDLREVEGVAVADVGAVGKTDAEYALEISPIFPINSSAISASLQNALTDYDFRVENISIETRVEKSQVNPVDLPIARFEVLDRKNLRIDFQLNENSQRLLGGRRLQFRIRDKQRGDSDWYTLKKTFARVPRISSIKCANKINENCEIKGEGIDYISQVSVDGGKTWFPQEPATLTVQPTPDGKSVASIPHYTNKKLFQVRLRDYPLQTLVFKSIYLPDAGLRKK